MSWIADNPEEHEGRVIANGHCVRFCQHCAGAPHTSKWRRGAKVRGNNIPRGTAIATFGPDGRYQNRTDGSSHAAILIEELADGLRVWDCWVGHPVQQRIIHFRAGKARPSNDGDKFHVVEEA